MYIVHLKKELCTTFKSTINENLTDFIAQAQVPVQVIVSRPLIAPDWGVKMVQLKSQKVCIRYRNLQKVQMQGHPSVAEHFCFLATWLISPIVILLSLDMKLSTLNVLNNKCCLFCHLLKCFSSHSKNRAAGTV